jgi:hypothetical protein
MLLKHFLESKGLPTKVTPKQSLKNTYEKTDTKITWIQLHGEVDGQDYLVMSATLAQNFEKDKAILHEAQVQWSDDAECWGLIMPATCTTFDDIEL